MSADRSPTAASGEPRAKGINFRSLVIACQRLLGQSVVDKMVSLLPNDLARQVQSNSFITGHWYPLSDYRTLHGVAQTASGRGIELARAIGYEAARDDFRGIYRVLTFVLSPEFVIKRTPSIWSRYYDVGEVSVEASAGRAHGHFRSAAGFDRVLWQDVMGGIGGILEACGGKGAEVQLVSGGGDEDHLEIEVRWK